MSSFPTSGAHDSGINLSLDTSEPEGEDDFPPVGCCLVYNPAKKSFGVPLPNQRRVSVTESLRRMNVLDALSGDYMEGFAQMLQTAAFGTVEQPRRKSMAPNAAMGQGFAEVTDTMETSEEMPCDTETNKSEFEELALKLDAAEDLLQRLKQHNSWNEAQRLPVKKPISRSKSRHKRQPVRWDGDDVWEPPSTLLRKRTHDSLEDDSQVDLNFHSIDQVMPDVLPVRQSERNISKKLDYVALDEGLGIGLDDDANQRRSWHKPRVKPRKITQHRFRGHKLIFLVQQPAGNCEWLDEDQVDDNLKNQYLAAYSALAEVSQSQVETSEPMYMV